MKSTYEHIEETETEVIGAPFALSLPPEFDVKPDWVIDLPRGYKALIYKTTRYVVLDATGSNGARDASDGSRFTYHTKEVIPLPTFVIEVIDAHGARADEVHESSYYDTPLNVSVRIKEIVRRLTPRRTKRRSTTSHY